MLEVLKPFFLSFMIGLFIGIERGRRQAGIFATIATLIGFLIVIIIVAPELVRFIAIPLIAAIGMGGLSTWLFMKNKPTQKVSITYPNPLDLKEVLKLASILMLILLLVGLTKDWIGIRALPITAFISGLFDIHAMGYAIGLLFNEASISRSTAIELLGIVVFASFMSKFALVWIIAHNRFAVVISLYLMLMLISGGLVYFMVLPYVMV